MHRQASDLVVFRVSKMENKNIKSIDDKGKSRRGFIKKSSVVAGIAVLPASNVWGTCNVSGVSGGSQQSNSTCVVSPFFGGYSPLYWSDIISTMPQQAQYDAFLALVSDLDSSSVFPITGASKAEFYYPRMGILLSKYDFSITGAGNIPSFHMNVHDALQSGTTKQKQLASVYANIIFGFVRGEPTLGTNGGIDLFLEHIWGSFHEGSASHTSSVVDASFDHTGTFDENKLMGLLSAHNIY